MKAAVWDETKHKTARDAHQKTELTARKHNENQNFNQIPSDLFNLSAHFQQYWAQTGQSIKTSAQLLSFTVAAAKSTLTAALQLKLHCHVHSNSSHL